MCNFAYLFQLHNHWILGQALQGNPGAQVWTNVNWLLTCCQLLLSRSWRVNKLRPTSRQQQICGQQLNWRFDSCFGGHRGMGLCKPSGLIVWSPVAANTRVIITSTEGFMWENIAPIVSKTFTLRLKHVPCTLPTRHTKAQPCCFVWSFKDIWFLKAIPPGFAQETHYLQPFS